jgi:hypothetical protein
MAQDTPAAGAPLARDVFIQSKMPADNGYGQNGYRGPSSDLPGQHTSTNFLPQCKIDKDYHNDKSFQTRTVSDKPYAAAHGMTGPKGEGVIPPNGRPVTKRIGK